jgi:hypothetical protein
VLYTALSPELDGMYSVKYPFYFCITILTFVTVASSGAFIVKNQIYNETRGYVTNDADGEKLWKLSEKLIGEDFAF